MRRCRVAIANADVSDFDRKKPRTFARVEPDGRHWERDRDRPSPRGSGKVPPAPCIP